MMKKYHVPKDVSGFIEKTCINILDNLIITKKLNEFDLELQIMHSFR
jgi:hypothetical protein